MEGGSINSHVGIEHRVSRGLLQEEKAIDYVEHCFGNPKFVVPQSKASVAME
jgi:hypothetical protein